MERIESNSGKKRSEDKSFNLKEISNTQPFDFFPSSDSSPGVLLIHGFSGTPGEMRYLGVRLAESGIGAHSVLLRGHGTNVDSLAQTSWQDWMEDVEEKVNFLQNFYKPSKLYLAGFSLGSLLAIRVYSKQNFEFAGLIVISLPLELNPLTEIVLSCYRMWLFPFDIKVPVSPVHDIVDKFAEQYIRSYKWVSMKAAWNLKDLAERVEKEDLDKIEGKVLILHGGIDMLAPVSNVELFCKKTKKAKITRKIFHGSGHMLPVDINREEVFEKVRDFVSK